MKESDKVIKAVIFDLNGVFILSPRLSERFEKDFKVPIDKFLPVLSEIMNKVREPNSASIYSLWKPFFLKWAIDLSEKDFLDYWFKVEKENDALVKLVKKLRKNEIKLFILSNNFKERSEYYDKNFLFLKEVFNKVYYSWKTGFIKPDPKALENILKDNNLKAGECLYFDDSEENIKVGKSLGINSYIFDDSSITMIEGLVSS